MLTVDDAPTVLTTADLLATDNDGLLRSDNGEGDLLLRRLLVSAVVKLLPKCLH